MMNRNFKNQPIQLPMVAGATLAIALTAALTSCSNSSKLASPAQTNKQSDQSVPAWTVRLQSACTGVTDNSCRGHYGFSIDANGLYKVGPAPGGQVITGQIAVDKFQTLAAQVKAIEGVSLANAESCDTLDDSTSGGDTLTLTQGSTEKVVLAVKQDESCYEIADTAPWTTYTSPSKRLRTPIILMSFQTPVPTL